MTLFFSEADGFRMQKNQQQQGHSQANTARALISLERSSPQQQTWTQTWQEGASGDCCARASTLQNRAANGAGSAHQLGVVDKHDKR
jgi:hypothetical protein